MSTAISRKPEGGIPSVRKFVKNVNQDVPKHWLADNIMATHILNSMHMIFPDGERFFIRSVQRYMDDIKDENLRKRVKGFIGQEVQHGKSHEQFWKTLEEQGLDPMRFREYYEKNAYSGAEKFFISLFGEKMALSVTVALEHWTAMMAEMGLQNKTIDHLMPEEMAKLLNWHAAEEIEHKSVAFDVLKHVDDSYALRTGGFVVGTFFLWYYAALGTVYFIAKDEDRNLPKLAVDTVKMLGFLGMKGASIVTEISKYFAPDFHPDQNENYELAQAVFNSQPDSVMELKKVG